MSDAPIPPTRGSVGPAPSEPDEVPDPYRWLEAPAHDARVRDFLAGQDERAAAAMAGLDGREAFRAQLEQLWAVPRVGVPWRRGGRWFQLANDGTQDQDVLWTAPAASDDGGARRDPEVGAVVPAAGWTVAVDPNGWSSDGTSALSGLATTDAGDRLAVGRSDAGSDWVTWQVVDLAVDGATTVRPDRVRWSKFSAAAWLPGGEAFLYGAYDAPPAGDEVVAAVRDQRLQLHAVGTDAADDAVVHARPDQPEWGFHPHVAHGGRWVVLTIWRGTERRSRLHVASLTHGTGAADADGGGVAVGPGGIGDVRPLIDHDVPGAGPGEPANWEPVGVLVGADATADELVCVTDHDAPLGRVVAVRLTDGTTRELVAAGTDRLESARLVGGEGPEDPAWLVLATLHHATSRVAVHDARTGAHRHDVVLPDLATVTAVSGGRSDRAIHLAVSSFVTADEVWRHDLAAGTTARVRTSQVPAPAAVIVTEQLRVHHRDQVPADLHLPDGVAGDGEVAVPVFVVHRADVTPGDAPTILWGYGGFDIPVTPAFRPGWRAWVDAGGVLAVACLRGGGEYGRVWHEAGRGARRPAVQADALAVAAWLTGDHEGEVRASLGPVHAGVVPSGAAGPDVVWSAPAHLGVEGRSNGGLLVGTCVTAAPHRFGSAVPEVGVLDLLRFHRFTIGWAWTSDYGSPDDPEQFPVLHELSPYHRLLRAADLGGVAHPPTLITTGDTDDRVVPAHSFKYAAALQAAQIGDARVVLRVDRSAGHGAGKPRAKLLDERADVLAWHATHLGLPV